MGTASSGRQSRPIKARRHGAGENGLDLADYRVLAGFRYALRRFLSFSESAAGKVGLTPQQYQALLVLKSHAGVEVITINELAGQLFIRHNSAVGLVDRLEGEGLIARSTVAADRRKVNLQLTSKGARVFARLAAAHRMELRRIGPELARFLTYLSRPPGKGGALPL